MINHRGDFFFFNLYFQIGFVIIVAYNFCSKISNGNNAIVMIVNIKLDILTPSIFCLGILLWTVKKNVVLNK